MARIARIVVPGYLHHITQRGNRRMPVFFSDDDHRACLALVAEHCEACGVRVLAWSLMPNHVHLVAVPREARWPGPRDRRGAPPVHPPDQLPQTVARVSVAGAFRVVRYGSGALPGCGKVHRAQSRARGPAAANHAGEAGLAPTFCTSTARALSCINCGAAWSPCGVVSV
jgi:hypothetical protein